MEHLSINEVHRRLEEISDWHFVNDGISRHFEFANFKKAMEFVNKVAEEAEKMDHHPDITINYNKVTLFLVTHSANGLTHKDFKLAKVIDSFC